MRIQIDRATGAETILKPLTADDVARYNAALASEVRDKVFQKYMEAEDALSDKSNRGV